MGEFSLPHILIVLVIVLVFFGPSRLPGLGKSLGEAIRGFKQGITPDDSANNINHNAQQTRQTILPPASGPTETASTTRVNESEPTPFRG